uniref:EOG090X054E n=1 Tax=Evadne anonyx TaxID=141404 RepID=A0A9N6ZGG6_9CRUS|nr:EOG090X054E [Evadne anonyx]
MALRDLADGECGGRNPMLKVASHFTQDKAFRQEQHNPSFSSAERPVEDAMVKEFLEGIQAPSRPVGSNAFHMGTLLQEMRELERPKVYQYPIQTGPNVAEFAFKQESSWADDFLKNETHVLTENIPSASGWSQEFLDQPGYKDSETNYMAEWETQWDNLTSHIEKPNLAVQNKELTQTASNIVTSMNDPKFAQSEFMQKVSHGEESLTSSDKLVDGTSSTGQSNWADEFAGSSGITDQEPNLDLDWAEEFTFKTNQTTDEKWVQEFTGGASAEMFKSDAANQDDFWSQLQKDWDKAAEEDPSLGWLKGTPLEPVNEYTFEAENPYQEHADPFNEGLQKKVEGDLPSAILLFEAALQKDPDHMKAWELLGLSLAENEQDPGAITAYKRCLALESSNLVAIMGLAVSYTNESYQFQACQALEDWLRNNPKYSHLVSTISQQEKLVGSLVSGDTFNRVQDMYMRAARLQPAANLDPDVQTGLGVLLNLSSDFDKAPDCFRAALQMKPNDSLLWNRLGATLANGGHSEEAVQAYYKALELSPGFIRARYNLAVSCINLGVHREAAEHLVSALLHQQKGSRRVMSDNIWSTLRMVLNLMNRREFLADIDAR